MRITINGKEETLDKDDVTVSGLLAQKGVTAIEMVTVQLNGNFVNKDELQVTTLKPDDEVDFVYFMGEEKRLKAGSSRLLAQSSWLKAEREAYQND